MDAREPLLDVRIHRVQDRRGEVYKNYHQYSILYSLSLSLCLSDCTIQVVEGGKKLKMRFDDYVTYMKNNHDEDPIYLFDPSFGERAPTLLRDYTVPEYASPTIPAA